MKINYDQLKSRYDLKNKRVAVLATDGFEQSELDEPVKVLKMCGADVDIIAPEGTSIRGWTGKDWGESRDVDCLISDVTPDDYDSLVLPGGVLNSDALRTYPEAVAFAKEFFEEKKPVAAICHGGQILIDADVVDGRNLTSYKALRMDFENAGANWEDSSVVVDQGFTTSRTPDDLPDFCDKMCEEILEGEHAGQHA